MSLDINAVIKSMGNAAADILKENLNDIPPYLKDIFENKKETLKILAEARLSGVISEKEFNNELKREKKVLEAEMLTISIISKAAAQKAVNAAINVLTDAVKLAV